MIDIRNVKLRDEIPENIRRDSKVIALARSLDRSLEASSKMIDSINYEMNLQSLDESIIDHLLWENNVKQLEGLMFARNKAEKINLLKSIKDLKRTKGTPYAIERVLEVMGMKGYVEEWFQYDALPFHFLVELEIANDFREIEDVRKMVMHYKNTRSWFDGFVVLMAPGDFILRDDSYSYPVFYKDCGWFSGVKYFSGLDVGTIKLLSRDYDYDVSYEVSEKKMQYVESCSVETTDDSYDYVKKLFSCGDMETLLKEVETQVSSLECSKEIYDYNVENEVTEKGITTVNGDSANLTDLTYDYNKEFPIASEMELLTKHVDIQHSKTTYKEESYGFRKVYPVCGEFYAEE